MSKQPVPKVSQADVERVVRRDFPRDGARAFEILSAYGKEISRGDPDRVHLAVLKMADGSLEGLQQWVEAAKVDPRDVIVAAEYPLAFDQWPDREKGSPEAKQKTYDADWENYRQWLERRL